MEKYKVIAGRGIEKDGKLFISINREACTPCEADAMTHYLCLKLNGINIWETRNFDAYLQYYMLK